MPTPRAEPLDVLSLRNVIAKYPGLEHLRVRRYGSTLIVESGPADDPVRHVRFRRDTVHLWRLDIANHRGQWQSTGERGLLDKLFDLVATTYGWVLGDRV